MAERYQRRPSDWRRVAWRLIGAALVALGVAGWIAGMPRPSPVAAQELPRLVVIPGVVDVGTIQKSRGRVEARFTLRNEGRAPLRIQRIVPT